MLVLSRPLLEVMVGHCIGGAPLEACGLLTGRPTGDSSVRVDECLPATNDAHSSRVYTVAPVDLLRADRRASEHGAEVVGVYHSHTHTEGYPSPTDVAQAPDPDWHYVLVSLRDLQPSVRSYRIVAGKIEEEQVVLE